MDKTVRKPRGGFKRGLVQLYAAVLYNCYARGFIKGDIYTGSAKMLCVPGLNCYSCPGAVGACPLGALQNAIAASGARAPSYVLGVLLLYGLLLGRTVCGWLCPVGLLQELCHRVPTPKLSKNRATRALSLFKYLALFALVFLIPYWYSFKLLPLPAFCKYVCPAGTLEGAILLLSNPANSGKLSMLGGLFTNKFIILIAVLCLSVFVYRFFCRFLCPLGAIYSLFSRIAFIGVKVDRAACVGCDQCVRKCKMDIRHVGDRECIHCGECIDVCPTGAISFKAGRITLRGSDLTKPAAESDKKAGKRWLRTAVLCAFLLALLAGVAAFAHLSDPAQAVSVKPVAAENTNGADESLPVGNEVGMRAPDFTADLYGGGQFTLSEHLGKTVVVNFWATWCGPCVAELPNFDALYTEYGGKAEIIALHSDIVTDDVDAYLANFTYAMPFGLDADGGVIASFGGGTMLPQTVVIDKNGVIAYNEVGSMTYEKLKTLIEESLDRP